MQKLYCYVDESGQDTEGDLFIVAVVLATGDATPFAKVLEQIERSSGKGRVKWHEAKDDARLTYIRRVLTTPLFKGMLHYAVYRHTRDYLTRIVLTTARTITAASSLPYRATIFIDGLPKSQLQWVGSELRHLHIKTRKVRGVRKEESSALIRLADALCGFVRAALAGRNELTRVLRQAKQDGYVREL